MHKRHDVQRQHIIDSLDNLIFQLYSLSYFLSPALLPLLCRLASQFISYKPREVDPKLSLRVWFLVLCTSNVPSFWSHARDGATEGRVVILDFVGMGYLPSKTHLILLDILILCFQMVLTAISYEKSLHLSSPSTIPDLLSPPPTSQDASPPPTPTLDGDDDGQKYTAQHNHEPPFIVDLRLRHVFNRLRNPTPVMSDTDSASLPLPNTTPTPISMHLRAIVRRRVEARRRAQETEDAETPDTERRLPGSMGTEDAE
ncbi:hypothetical protein HYDPIDRAFT_116103 [Hydnomerulius pinastri MD-312]|uniref:DUF1746 domain-containing protein n=1 Tax=Hydnomerulius pinastri MD-312 TaxID=994086 RepID=A0A0C9WBM9_9AGAM|nr:hypothetical protein HYDPIDRAFT_116103 [Hydnomerulius pinastri MD-312]